MYDRGPFVSTGLPLLGVFAPLRLHVEIVFTWSREDEEHDLVEDSKIVAPGEIFV